jgi:hypothetical protein
MIKSEKNYAAFEGVRADKEGYYLIFKASVEGNKQAIECYKHYHRKKFNGITLYMNLV